MGKASAKQFLERVIHERFPQGPDRDRWLTWLQEFMVFGEQTTIVRGVGLEDLCVGHAPLPLTAAPKRRRRAHRRMRNLP